MPETSLDIIVRARDEASRKLSSIGKDFLGTAAKIGLAVGGIATVASVAAASFRAISAQAAVEAARVEGSVSEVLKAQLAFQDSLSDIGAAVPIIGSLIKAAMDKWGDRAGIEAAIKNAERLEATVKRVEAAVERSFASALRFNQESRLQAARNRDAAQSELLAIGEADKGRQLQLQLTKAIALEQERIANLEEVAGKGAAKRILLTTGKLGGGQAFRTAGETARAAVAARVELEAAIRALTSEKEKAIDVQALKETEERAQRRNSIIEALEDARLRRLDDRHQIEIVATMRKFDRLASFAQDHSDLLLKIEMEREASLAAIRTRTVTTRTDVEGFFARFLTRAPGRDSLTVTLKEELQAQTETLEAATLSLPAAIGAEVGKNIIQVDL